MGKSLPADLQNVKPEDITIWIDPLDGTMEFIDRLLHHVTILIGVAVGDKGILRLFGQSCNFEPSCCWSYQPTFLWF